MLDHLKQHTDKPPEHDRAMEGRLVRDGINLGDKHYFQAGWGLNEETEREALEKSAAEEITLAEIQAGAYLEENSEKGIRAYIGLITLYPNYERVSRWREIIEQQKKP